MILILKRQDVYFVHFLLVMRRPIIVKCYEFFAYDKTLLKAITDGTD